MPAKRRRQNKQMRQRDATVSYMLKSNKKTVRVCKKFFLTVFGLTKHRLVTVAKVLEEGGVPKEKRGGDRLSQKSVSKKEKVRQFIGNLRGKESHYNRKSLSVYTFLQLFRWRSCIKYITVNVIQKIESVMTCSETYF